MRKVRESESFGSLLRKYRRQSHDPVTGAQLTMQMVTTMLQDRMGASYTYQSVSNWERDKNQINKDDRSILIGLISLLHKCGGLKTLEDANLLLRAGNYRELDVGEVEKVNRHWLAAGEYEPNENPPGKPLSIVVNVLIEWLAHPEQQIRQLVGIDGSGLPPDFTDFFVYSLNRFAQRWTAHKALFLIGRLLLIIATWYLTLPLLFWPLTTPMISAVLFVVGAIFIPASIAGLDWLQERSFWLTVTTKNKQEGVRYLFAYTGAVTSFQIAYFALLVINIFLHDVSGHSLGSVWAIVQLSLAAGLVLMSYVGARQVPRSMWRAFGKLAFTEGDVSILIVFSLMGSLLAWGIVHYVDDLLRYRFVGIAIILVAFGVVAGLTAWRERKTGSSVLPASFWTGLYGLSWVLYNLQQSNWLRAADALVMTILLVILLRKNRLIFTLGGLLALSGISALLLLALRWNLVIGRILAMAVVVAWTLFGRKYVWFPLSFWFVAGVYLGALYLVSARSVTELTAAGGLILIGCAVAFWESRRL